MPTVSDLMQNWAEAIRQTARSLWNLDVSPWEPLFLPTLDLKFGDVSTGLAFRIARPLRRPPARIVSELLPRLTADALPGLGRAEAAGGGYINFFFSRSFLEDQTKSIVVQGEEFGRARPAKPLRILLEYVSANPVGPVTIASARQAAVGDALARILTAAGHEVTREYYVNDTGGQIEKLGMSIYHHIARRIGRDYPIPEGGYHGPYVAELAQECLSSRGAGLVEDPNAIEICSRYGKERMLEAIRTDLRTFRVEFDNWYSQEALEKSGKVAHVVQSFRDRGLTREEEGAIWLRTRDFAGDDKDRVLVKRDGTYTYRTPDIAYHIDKLERGFDQLIDLLGPDHHSESREVLMGLRLLGYDVEGRIRVLIVQHCRLLRGNEEVKMSKRLGTYVSLRDLIEEVGVDAARYFFVMRKTDSHLDFDLELAKKQSLDNPVYYVQYAHARICSIVREGLERGLIPAEDVRDLQFHGEADLSRLGSPEENLMRTLIRYPSVVAGAAADLDPTRLTTYLYKLSGEFQSFYDLGRKDRSVRVLVEDEPLRRARLLLCSAVQQTIRNACALLGITPVDRM